MLSVRHAAFSFILLIMVCCSTALCYADAKKRQPLNLDSILGVRTFGDRNPLALSPDGRLIAYTVIEPTRRHDGGDQFTQSGVPTDQAATDIRIADLKTETDSSVTDSQGSNWGPVWSPNGEYLAFYSDRGGKAQLWLWDRSSKHLRLASQEAVRVFFGFEVVRWMSDSKRLLIKLMPENMSLHDLTILTSGEKAPQEPNTGEKAPSVMVYSSKLVPNKEAMPFGWTNINLCDLAILDVTTGELRRLLRKKAIREILVSPRDDFAAITILKGMKPPSRTVLFDLVLLSLASGNFLTLSSNVPMGYGLGLSWSPTGEHLAFVSGDPEAGLAGDVYLAFARGGMVQAITRQVHPDFSHAYRPPIWDSYGKTLYFVSDSRLWEVDIKTGKVAERAADPDLAIEEIIGPSEGGRFSSPDHDHCIIARTRRRITSRAGFYEVSLESGKMTQLVEEAKSYADSPEGFFGQAATNNASLLAFIAEDARHPPDLWFFDMATRFPTRISVLNPQFEKADMGESRLIEYQDSRGKALHGALLLPTGFKTGEKYPLLIWVYGGADGSSYVNKFGFGNVAGVDNPQLFATRGYAVLYPDIPLSVGTPMKDTELAVLPAVRKVVDMGIADPGRVGVMGQSYGAYSVLALICQSTAFGAAVARGAQGDLFSTYARTQGGSDDSASLSWAEQGQGRMGGSPWEFRDRYIENSPFFFLDRVQTPLLLIHGSLDSTIPPYLGEEIFVGLKRLGKDVTYVKYTTEGHWEGDWNYADMVDEMQRIFDFFDSRLSHRAN